MPIYLQKSYSKPIRIDTFPKNSVNECFDEAKGY